jgi:hypothetical protein
LARKVVVPVVSTASVNVPPTSIPMHAAAWVVSTPASYRSLVRACAQSAARVWSFTPSSWKLRVRWACTVLSLNAELAGDLLVGQADHGPGQATGSATTTVLSS